MPIYTKTYRRYEGSPRRHGRWLVVMEQELKILARFRVFKALVLLACIHAILRLLQVVALDLLAQDPNHPLQMVFANLDLAYISPRTFLSFLYHQSSIVFILLLYAGSGMICNDARNNLLEVYFSKPMTWKDYALGKILTLITLGLMITAVPGIILVIVHNLLLPGLATLGDSWWWPLSILAYSLAIVVPTALCILAASALLPSQNYASITILMALIANSSLGLLLAGMLRHRNYMGVSFPLTLRRIGETVFQDRPYFSLAWQWSLLYIVVVSVVALAIIVHKVRRAEIAS